VVHAGTTSTLALGVVVHKLEFVVKVGSSWCEQLFLLLRRNRKAINVKMRKARPPIAPPIIGPRDCPALDEATGDVIPEGTAVTKDTTWALCVGESTGVVESTVIKEREIVDDVDVGAPESGRLDDEERMSVDNGVAVSSGVIAVSSGVISI